MNKERYVSYEIAKLLKEKKFYWDCEHYYKPNGEIVRASHINGSQHINSSVLYEHQCLAPTEQMAVSWLMEEKHIFIGKSFTKNEETLNLEFYSPIFNMDTCELITTIGAFCYEDAVEAALEYVLTNLI